MSLELSLQCVSEHSEIPDKSQFEKWAKAVLKSESEVVMNIRLVDNKESAELNLRYRGRKGATNVLSFPAELPDEIDLNLLGDLVICAPLVEREAQQAGIRCKDHWAHLVVHGILHLLGFDHEEESDANRMESEEIKILSSLGIANPYN